MIYKVWLCTNGEECGGHEDGNHGRSRTVEADHERRAAEDAGEEFCGPFGDLDAGEMIREGARVHVVDAKGVETTWSLEARINVDARPAEWHPWTRAIGWLPEHIRAAALPGRIFAEVHKAIVLDGTTWVTNGHLLLAVGKVEPRFELLPQKTEEYVRRILVFGGSGLAESERWTNERGEALVQFQSGVPATASYIDFVAAVWPGVTWYSSVDRSDPDDDPPLVAVLSGAAVAVVMPRKRTKGQV